MKIFDYFVKAICKESEKCQVFFNKETCKINNNLDENFEAPVNRLAYLYKFGVFYIHFIKESFLSFSTDCSEASKIINIICSAKCICSLSVGPGIDIVGVLFAFQELKKSLNEDVEFKIINKNGAWRNSLNALISIEGPNIPSFKNFKLLGCNIFQDFSQKAQRHIQTADVILMDHAFESHKIKKEVILKTLKKVTELLKPESYIILINPKSKLNYFDSIKAYGTFVYGPKEIQVNNMQFDEVIVKMIGVEPVRSGKQYFAIWCRNNLPVDVSLHSSMFVNVFPAVKKNEVQSSNSRINTPSTNFDSNRSSLSSTPVKNHEKNTFSSTPEVINNSNMSTQTSQFNLKETTPVKYSDINCSNFSDENYKNGNSLFINLPTVLQSKTASSLSSEMECLLFNKSRSSKNSAIVSNPVKDVESVPLQIMNSVSDSQTNTEQISFADFSSKRIQYDRQTLLNLNKAMRNLNYVPMKLPDIVVKNIQITNITGKNVIGDLNRVITNNECYSKDDIGVLLKTFDNLVSKLETVMNSEMFANKISHKNGFENGNKHSHNCSDATFQCSCTCAGICAIKECTCIHNTFSCTGNRDGNNIPVETMQNINYKAVPHIVIPLHNVNAENIAQIMSLIQK